MKRFSALLCLPSLTLVAMACLAMLPCGWAVAQDDDPRVRTIIVTAEGLADPNADTYKRDRGLLIDALREDARRQAIEKAVGCLVGSSTVVENYVLLRDKVFTRSQGLIKRVIKESEPWLGSDGFMHMLLRAEVYLADVRNALEQMSRDERVSLIKEHGNVTISVGVTVRNAERGPSVAAERSSIAENILKERMSSFGYRVWSEEMSEKLKVEAMQRSQMDNSTEATVSIAHQKAANFSILGEAKFKKVSMEFKTADMVLSKYVLTSWTVKCVDNASGEEIYFNNKVPKGKSWNDEDAALESIGALIADEFSKDFFENYLMSPAKTYQVQVIGLPDYDAGVLLKKELVGLRSVLNVDFRNYDQNGLSLFEVEFAGSSLGSFWEFLTKSIIKPINAKLGEEALSLTTAQGNVVKLRFQTRRNWKEIVARMDSMPPASLVDAPAERIAAIAQNAATMQKVAAINPRATEKLAKEGNTTAREAVRAVKDF